MVPEVVDFLGVGKAIEGFGLDRSRAYGKIKSRNVRMPAIVSGGGTDGFSGVGTGEGMAEGSDGFVDPPDLEPRHTCLVAMAAKKGFVDAETANGFPCVDGGARRPVPSVALSEEVARRAQFDEVRPHVLLGRDADLQLVVLRQLVFVAVSVPSAFASHATNSSPTPPAGSSRKK